MLNNRIACHGSPVKKNSVEMAKTEVKPCVTKKLSPDELKAELEKMGVRDMRMKSGLTKVTLQSYIDDGLTCDELAKASGLSKSTVIKKAEQCGLKDEMKKNEPKKKMGRPRKNPPVDVAPDIIPSEPSEMSEPAVTENKKCIITLDDIDKSIEKVHHDLDDLMATKCTIERMAAGNEIAVEVDADA